MSEGKWWVPTWSAALGIVVIGAGVFSIATPKFGAARTRANLRACYANQKTLAGAVKAMYEDRGELVTDLPARAGDLVAAGYLQTYPEDPGGDGVYSVTATRRGCPAHPAGAADGCDPCRRTPPAVRVTCSGHGSYPAPPTRRP